MPRLEEQLAIVHGQQPVGGQRAQPVRIEAIGQRRRASEREDRACSFQIPDRLMAPATEDSIERGAEARPAASAVPPASSRHSVTRKPEMAAFILRRVIRSSVDLGQTPLRSAPQAPTSAIARIAPHMRFRAPTPLVAALLALLPTAAWATAEPWQMGQQHRRHADHGAGAQLPRSAAVDHHGDRGLRVRAAGLRLLAFRREPQSGAVAALAQHAARDRLDRGAGADPGDHRDPVLQAALLHGRAARDRADDQGDRPPVVLELRRTRTTATSPSTPT